EPRLEGHARMELRHGLVHPRHAPEQRDLVSLPRLKDTFQRDEKPAARLSCGSLAEVDEPFRVASSGHEAAGERHDSSNVRARPPHGPLQRFQLEIRHDGPLGGHRARASHENDADDDREHPCGPAREAHVTSSVRTVCMLSTVSTLNELTSARAHVYNRRGTLSRLLL